MRRDLIVALYFFFTIVALLLTLSRRVQITFNSSAMDSLYEPLCYHSLEDFDPIMDELLTFYQVTLSSLYSSSAVSTVIPEATDCHFSEF